MRIDIGGGVKLFVDIDGQGLVPDGPTMVQRPTVLLMHGGPGMDHSLYKASPLSALTDVAQVVYYDHRSQGRSDPRPPDEWTLDMWADEEGERWAVWWGAGRSGCPAPRRPPGWARTSGRPGTRRGCAS